MRESKYELKTTLNYLKSKVDEFERKQFVKNELIHDSLGKMFGQNLQNMADVNVGQKLIGAKGGVGIGGRGKESEKEEEDGKSLRFVVSENLQ